MDRRRQPQAPSEPDTRTSEASGPGSHFLEILRRLACGKGDHHVEGGAFVEVPGLPRS